MGAHKVIRRKPHAGRAPLAWVDAARCTASCARRNAQRPLPSGLGAAARRMLRTASRGGSRGGRPLPAVRRVAPRPRPAPTRRTPLHTSPGRRGWKLTAAPYGSRLHHQAEYTCGGAQCSGAFGCSSQHTAVTSLDRVASWHVMLPWAVVRLCFAAVLSAPQHQRLQCTAMCTQSCAAAACLLSSTLPHACCIAPITGLALSEPAAAAAGRRQAVPSVVHGRRRMPAAADTASHQVREVACRRMHM